MTRERFAADCFHQQEVCEPAVRSAALGIFGLRGMGGLGKTVLASALVQDNETRALFADGVVWLDFGRKATLRALGAGITSLLRTRDQTNVEVVLEVSVDALEPIAKKCFLAYAAFPRGAAIPRAALRRLWSNCAADEYERTRWRTISKIAH